MYGEELINGAYGKHGALIFIQNGENKNLHVRNLFSGAYSLFRNPRQHRIVEDDVNSAEAIINLLSLLVSIIEESEKVQPNEN